MAPDEPTHEDRLFQRRAVQSSIRVGLIFALAYWSFRIVKPFIDPFFWGAIIAIATYPVYRLILRWVRGRSRVAAVIIVLLGLMVLLAPTAALGVSLLQTASTVAAELHDGTLSIPPPPTSVQSWPLVGARLYDLWEKASENVESVLSQFAPHLKEVALWLVQMAGATSWGVLKFMLSILIAGVLLARANDAANAARAIATRLTGERGPELTHIAGVTIFSVTRGILGVAVVQSLLAGLGMLAVKVPAAGLWALLVLILSIVQLPAMLILIPIIVYVFFNNSIGVAVVFAVWSTLVGLSDTPLRPLLMGRAANVPTLVIFVGAIGGFLFQGIIGLFVGAVVLALGYTLFVAWLREQTASALTGES